MKFWAVNLTLGLILLTTVGCDRQDPADDNPDAFDPDLDPTARLISVETNPDILEDQSTISERAKESKSTRRTTPAASGDAAATSDDPVEIVKAKVTAAFEGFNKKDPEPFIAMLDDEFAQLMGPVMRVGLELEKKALALEELIQDQLVMELTPDLKSMISGKLSGPPMDFQTDSLDDFTFEVDGDNVVVTGPDGKPMVFEPVDSDYKVALPEEAKDPMAAQMLASIADMADAQISFIDEVTAGIEAGEITADNFEPAVTAIFDRTAKPAMEKLMGSQFSPPAQPDGMDDTPSEPRFKSTGLNRMVNPAGDEPLD